MKKYLAIFMAAMLLAGCLSACGSTHTVEAADTKPLQIVTTIFPEYDWVMNILGENPGKAQVTMLLDEGVDLHSYQPTADDIMKVATCDLFVYVGGESDGWVEDALQEAVNKDMVVINLLETLGDSVKEEEMVEGMQEEAHDHDHGHEEEHEHEEDEAHEDGHKHEEETEYDEHVWLSLRNASALVESISEALIRLDGAHKELYQSNAESYVGRLKALDEKYSAAVAAGNRRTLLFGDRFPFRYLVDDYGLEYYAAFVGCSAETEASFETISFLAGKVDELKLPAVMTIEGNDHRIAETIIENTKTKDQQILTMDSMQSVTAKDVQSGTTYLSVMEQDLEALKAALQ